MKSIFVTGDPALFKLGTNSPALECVVSDVNIERKTISESVSTMVYYDLDVFYDKEMSLHTQIKHIHDSFVLPQIKH